MIALDSRFRSLTLIAALVVFGASAAEVPPAGAVALMGDDPISFVSGGVATDYQTSVVPSGSSFTISLLFKTNGCGPGEDGWNNGMIVSAGSGWDNGFRVMCYDQAKLLPAFEVGRDVGSLGMTSPEGLVKEVWHHLAVTLSDDHVGKIYIDGSLFAKREEMPTPIFNGQPVRLGYVGYGVGSLDLVIAAAEYYPRALTETEVVQSLGAMIEGRGAEFDPLRSEVYPDPKALIAELIPDPEPEVAPTPAPARSLDRSGWERIDFAPGEVDDAARLQAVVDEENAKDASGRRIEVAFAPGRYRFASSVRLSGQKNRWAFVARDRQTRVELSGGVVVQASEFASEQDASGRVSAAVEVPMPRPYRVGTDPQFGVIPFADGDKVMPMSVWPNDGYMSIPFSVGERTMRPGGLPVPAGRSFLAHGYWMFDWADAGLTCQSEDDGVVRTTSESNYGFNSTVRVQFENAREFADLPGEWAVEAGRFVMMPPTDGFTEVTLPRLETPFFVVESADAPVFEGLSFVSCCSDALVMRRLSGARVDDCGFFAVGGTAVVAEDCDESSITWCSVSHTGYDGVKLSSGSRETLTLGNSSVANCSFSDIGLLARTYTPAVLLRGCGCRVCSCTVRRVPSSAFRIEGNEHRVCHCLVEDVVLESDDQGATDSYGDPSFRACHYAYNVFRRIGGDGVATTGRGGIRLDDMISGMYVYGNRFIEASRGNFGGVQIHGGQHNRIVGNVFEDCSIAFSFNPWGRDRWIQQLDNTTPGEKNKGYAETELYRERYPELLRLREDVDVNRVVGNILIRCGQRFNNKPESVIAYANRSISEGSWEPDEDEPELPPAEQPTNATMQAWFAYTAATEQVVGGAWQAVTEDGVKVFLPTAASKDGDLVYVDVQAKFPSVAASKLPASVSAQGALSAADGYLYVFAASGWTKLVNAAVAADTEQSYRVEFDYGSANAPRLRVWEVVDGGFVELKDANGTSWFVLTANTFKCFTSLAFSGDGTIGDFIGTSENGPREVVTIEVPSFTDKDGQVKGGISLRTVDSKPVFSVTIANAKKGAYYTAFVANTLSADPKDWVAAAASVTPEADGLLTLDIVRDDSPSKFAKIVATPVAVAAGTKLSECIR